MPPGWLNETFLCHDAEPGRTAPAAAEGGEAEGAELVGRTLDVYECRSLLGAGGMGQVYLAFHQKLHRLCALKVLHPRTARDDVDFPDRFRNEGRTAAALVHPNIVTVHATGECAGLFYLEMEYVAGHSLQWHIHRQHRLTPVRATVLAAAIAEGLSAAHRQNILHRDLKPDNVLLTPQGLPKIADFGLAKRIVDNSRNEQLAGTPNFMAPELLMGSPATPASDVYALGVCYFLMLTGRLPFTGGTLAELRRSVHSQPLPNLREQIPELPLEMAECVALLLSKSPSNRPRDGIEAAQLLKAIAGEVRDIESLLQEAFAGFPSVRWSRTGRRYHLHVVLPDGRKQTLFIEPSDHRAGNRLLLIYSVCCPVKADYYETALRLNAEISHGAVAVREMDGEPHFVVADTYPRATVDAEEIRRSVLVVAYQADEIEKRLTGCDRH